MLCPVCFGEMEEERHGGVQLDLCSRCPGVWFDGGELAAYQEGEGSPYLEGVPRPDSKFEPSGDSGKFIRCPGCEHDILRLWTISRHEVLRCTTCGGLFLPLSGSNEHPKPKDNVLTAAIHAIEEVVPWILGREKNGTDSAESRSKDPVG